MAKTAIVALALSTATLGACSTVSQLPTERLGSANLSYANGVPAGTVQLLSNGQQLSLAVAVTGVKAGPHGIHLHTTGACAAPDFKSAGGHLNPTARQHGALNPAGSHLGDLPNLNVGSNRSVAITIDLAGDPATILSSIFDDDGTAIIIHEGEDDYRSDPAGNAGSRLICGVLKRA